MNNMETATATKKKWRHKRSTFYLCIGGEDKIPFICEKDGKYPIDKYKAYYCSGGEWNMISSENPSMERIAVFFNSKCQKVDLETITGNKLSIDVFLCRWHERITDSNKTLLLQRMAEGEDQFAVFYLDFFGLDSMNTGLLQILENEIIRKMVPNDIPQSNSSILKLETLAR